MRTLVAFVFLVGAVLQPAAQFTVTASISNGTQEVVRAQVWNDRILIATHLREGTGAPSYLSLLAEDGRSIWRQEIPGKIYRLRLAGNRAFIWIAGGEGTELRIVSARDGSMVAHFPIEHEEDAVAVALDGSAIAVFRDSTETGPSNQVQVRNLDTGRTWGLITDGAVTRVALADDQRVFIGKIDGTVDAYLNHTRMWTGSFDAASAVTELQTSRAGGTVLAAGRSGRLAIFHGKTGEKVLSYDPLADAALEVLGVNDDVVLFRQRRPPEPSAQLSDSQIGRRLRLFLQEDGLVRVFDASRDKIPVEREFDPYQPARPRNEEALAVWSALASSGIADPEARAIGFDNGPRVVMSANKQLAVVAFDDRVIILRRHR